MILFGRVYEAEPICSEVWSEDHKISLYLMDIEVETLHFDVRLIPACDPGTWEIDGIKLKPEHKPEMMAPPHMQRELINYVLRDRDQFELLDHAAEGLWS
ncbi:hypothetical protein [Rhodoligotrophos ferricapiens]|uniref:hypothetical protein n=1 Tax=Rhodoligotrophos ferricapiens TaxID=3069264 RepID=UPI00315D832F